MWCYNVTYLKTMIFNSELMILLKFRVKKLDFVYTFDIIRVYKINTLRIKR